jgi:hypothetical protein
LDALVAEAVVDAYDDEEQLAGLYTMIADDLAVPFTTRVLGVEVTVRRIELRTGGIVAVCHGAGCGRRSESWICRCRTRRPGACNSASSWATRTHVILDLSSEDEDGDEWCDGEGRLASIVPVRAELAAGDRRLLYLAWLLCVQGRELDDDEPEPQVPAGLRDLSGPLQSLVEFLRLDPDLLAAAAEASAEREAKSASAAALRRWAKALPERDEDDIVVRLMAGEDAHLRAELLRRFHGPSPADATQPRRTVGELLAAAEARWAQRQRRVREREAAGRKRREQAAAAARQQRLDALAGRQEQAWQQIDTLVETKKPKEYDSAVTLLADLQALAEQDGGGAAFVERMRGLRQRHARKPSLLDRFNRAGLG